MSASVLTPLEATLRAKRDAGRKILVPYVTGGLQGWRMRSGQPQPMEPM